MTSNLKLFLILVLPPILIFGCALIMLRVPLPYSLSRRRDLFAAVGGGILGLVYIVGLTLYVLNWLRGGSHIADPAMNPLGLEASSYALFGRQYHGTVQGRQVDVYFTPRQRLSPARLDLYLGASLQTRLAVAERRPLLCGKGCQPLTPADPDLGRLHILALDLAWAGDLLADPTARAALLQLTADGPAGRQIEFYVQPGTLWLRLHPLELTAESVGQWLEDLRTLAQVGEGLSAGRLPVPGPQPVPHHPQEQVTPAITLILLAIGIPTCMVLGAIVVLAILRAR